MAISILTAPWYALVRQFRFTFGEDSSVFVDNLIDLGKGKYTLPINVTSDSAAHALRQIIPSTFNFGNITVTTAVYDSKGKETLINNTAYTPETLASLFKDALIMNPLFVGTVLKPKNAPTTLGDVIVIADKVVVQFFNDDISDLCGNYNEVAAKAFSEITTTSYAPNLKVTFSTYDSNCPLQQSLSSKS